MKKITIGEYVAAAARRAAAHIDLSVLLGSRLLLQANSGAGKSRALRRLIEQSAGVLQQLVIDPEGEFASLREKHDFVIVAGAGGDVSAHPRTAALLARRLRETRISAVLDISELKADHRHEFTHLFCDALIECPKSLWNPCSVIVDEAQIFAPEKGQGESIACASIIDLATRGRKRGLCLIAATLRISQLHKSVAGELKNRLIGGTSLDVDLKRAAFDLGLSHAEARDLLRALLPGHFYAYGPAFGHSEPRELVTGEVFTSHPKVGAQRAAEPPKPTAAVIAMLPKLADLPKEVEQKAATEKELRKQIADAGREIAEVRRQLAQAQRAPAVPRVDPEALKKAAADNLRRGVQIGLGEARQAARDTMRKCVALMEQRMEELAVSSVNAYAQLPALPPATVKVPVAASPAQALKAAPVAARPVPAASVSHASNGELPKGHAALLALLIQFPDGLKREQISVMASLARSTRDRYIQHLQAQGLATVEPSTDLVLATDEGRAALPNAQALPMGPELQEHWLRRLPDGERSILQILIEAHPNDVPRDEISERTKLARSTRDRYLQKLQAKMVVTTTKGAAKAAESLF